VASSKNSIGDVAQLGEHLLCKQGVAGSNPVISTNTDSGLSSTFFDNKNRVKYTGIFVRFLVKLLRANGGCLGADRR
jgi:hypothetical protein